MVLVIFGIWGEKLGGLRIEWEKKGNVESDFIRKKFFYERKEINGIVMRGWGGFNKRIIIGRNFKYVYMLKGVIRGGVNVGRREVRNGDVIWGGGRDRF